MRAAELRRLMNRNAVLLALHALGDDEGLLCHATNGGIAAATKRSAQAVRIALRELEGETAVTMLDWRDGLSHRVFVLRDHPQAKGYIRHIRKANRAFRGQTQKG